MANSIVKKGGTESEYTPEMVQELIKCHRSPTYFIDNYIYLQHPVKGMILFHLYDFQRHMIENLQQHNRCIILASRQCGKCVLDDTRINTIEKPSKFKLWILKIISPGVYKNVKALFDM